jgi:hypothetical protein
MLLLAFFLKDTELLWVMWLVAGQIWLNPPSAVEVVDGESRSGSWRCWGAAPVDGRPPTALSISTPLKAYVRWDLSCSWWCSASSSSAADEDEDDDHRWFAEDPRALM